MRITVRSLLPCTAMTLAAGLLAGAQSPRTHRLEARAAVANGRGNGALRKVGAVQEGVVDQDRFSSYLETAMAEMAPGIEDKRTLFSLRQLITALRAPVTSKPVQ